MERLTILGTGSAMVTRCYNTCFTLSCSGEHFLVDAGGGNGILAQLERARIPIERVRCAFVSHNHNDHLLGMIWVLRLVAQQMLKEKYDGTFSLYAHPRSIEALKAIGIYVLQPKFRALFDKRILFHPIGDGTKLAWFPGMYRIAPEKRENYPHPERHEFTFFDIRSTKELQHGFALRSRKQKIVFLGDEPYNGLRPELCRDADFLLQEAFCTYNDREVFKPYEKHHATVKEACENARRLQARATVLLHTEDKTLDSRKQRYAEEGRKWYRGRIFVPDDLDTISLEDQAEGNL